MDTNLQQDNIFLQQENIIMENIKLQKENKLLKNDIKKKDLDLFHKNNLYNQEVCSNLKFKNRINKLEKYIVDLKRVKESYILRITDESNNIEIKILNEKVDDINNIINDLLDISNGGKIND